MIATFDVHGYEGSGKRETTEKTRRVTVKQEGYQISIRMGHKSGKADPDKRPLNPGVMLEWQPGKGWCVYVYALDDPHAKFILPGDGRVIRDDDLHQGHQYRRNEHRRR